MPSNGPIRFEMNLKTGFLVKSGNLNNDFSTVTVDTFYAIKAQEQIQLYMTLQFDLYH